MDWLYSIFGTPLGYIMWACYKLIPIYVLALVLFTLISKVALFPFAIKTHKASITQLVWKPKMDEIKKKYANNREKQNEEMQKLYTEEGMKLSTGCGATLIQFPILFGVIDVVYKPLTHLLHISGDVINNLATQIGVTGMDREIRILSAVQADPSKYMNTIGAGGAEVIQHMQSLNLNFLGINLGEVPTLAVNMMLIIPIIAGLTTILQTIFSMKLNPMSSEGGAGGKGMMYVMAIVFILFTFAVPAGVGLYWSVSNLFAILQIFILNKMYPPKAEAEKIRKQLEEKKKAAKKAKVAVRTADGKVVDVKQSELDSIRLARAREMEAQLYAYEGEQEIEETPVQKKKK